MSAARYLGYLNEPSGFGVSARNHLVALADAGADVFGVPAGLGPNQTPRFYPANTQLYPQLARVSFDERPFGVEVVHTMPESFPIFATEGAYSIGLTAWETPVLPPQWRDAVRRMDEIWVPSQFSAAAFRDIGPVVRVIPHPVTVDDLEPAVLPEIPDDVFAFLAILEWQDRKNPQGLVRNFMRAFEGRSDVALVMKVGTLFYGEWEQIVGALEQQLGEHHGAAGASNTPKIYVIRERLSPGTMRKLYRRADAYVSLHRAEGFGLCLAEAMATAKPVVATAYGGNTDFMDNASAFLVDYELVPAVERYAFRTAITSEMSWAEPDADAAVEAMRQCVAQPTLRKQRAEAGFERVTDYLSAASVGRSMKARLDEVGRS